MTPLIFFPAPIQSSYSKHQLNPKHQGRAVDWWDGWGTNPLQAAMIEREQPKPKITQYHQSNQAKYRTQ